MANKAIWQQAIVNSAGDIVIDASIEVRLEAGNALASLFDDRAGASGIGNPILPGSDGYPTPGFAVFYAAPGVYKITSTSPTSGTRTLRYVVLLADATVNQASELLGANIASGTVQDYDASAGLTPSVGVLALNPSAGNTDLASIAWDNFSDGAELVIRNVHASNMLTIKTGGAASSGYKAFSGFGDVLMLLGMSIKVKKSVGTDAWIILS